MKPALAAGLAGKTDFTPTPGSSSDFSLWTRMPRSPAGASTFWIVPGVSQTLSYKGLFTKYKALGGADGELARYHVPGNMVYYAPSGKTTELAAFLERWRRDGYFREGFQPQAAAQAILSLLEGALLFSKASKSPEPVESAKRLAVAYLEATRAWGRGRAAETPQETT